MKAFAFLNGSKKQQQQQQQQQQRQQQQRTLLSINLSPRSSQDHEPHQIPTSRVQSPAYSTISFFSSKSSSSRAGSGANTPEPSHTMYTSDSASSRSGKARPSLTLLRPRLSSDGNHQPSSELPQKTGGRLNIYSRFGFSKSSSQLPQDSPTTPTYPTPPPLPVMVPALPVSSPVTPNRQYQLLHQQMFPETAAVVVQPAPPALRIDLDLPPPIPTRPPRANLPLDLEDPVSTSIILQRRRAKSLGHANAGSPGQRVTALKIPLPTAYPAPPLPSSSRADTASYLPATTTPLHVPASKALTTGLPPTPSTSASMFTSELGLNLTPTSSRIRSESNANSVRSRSESNSSRARSESNSSSASSSRHGHGYSSSYKSSRASKTATLGRIDNLWDGFLKEIDEDMSDLCIDISPIHSAATTPTRPARIEGDGLFDDTVKVPRPALSPRSRATSSPLRKGATRLGAAPTSVDAKPSIPLSAPGPRPDLRQARSFPSPPMTAPMVTTTTSSGTIAIATSGGFPLTPFKQSASHDTISSLPYLNSPGSSFKQSPDPNDVQILHARVARPQQPTLLQSLSPTNLRSPDPSLTIPKPPSPVPDPEDSRPCSTYSQSSQVSGFSQFSLSQFPSPPSVPLIRPTTDAGTFITSRLVQPEVQSTLPLRFKPIVPSTRVKPPIRPVLFERDENGHAVLSMPLRAPKFSSSSPLSGGSSSQSAYSSASSSASSSGTGPYSSSEQLTFSHRGAIPTSR